MVQMRERWSITGDGVAGAAVTLTKAAIAGQRHYICGLEVVVSAASVQTEVTIQLQNGSTTVYKGIIGALAGRGTRIWREFVEPIPMSAGAAANLACSAPGGTCVITANMNGGTA